MENSASKKTTENVLSESELKTLTKFVLNEIAPRHNSNNNSNNPFTQMFQALNKHLGDETPAFRYTDAAKKMGKDLIRNLRAAIKAIIQSHFNTSKEAYRHAVNSFGVTREEIIQLAVLWAKDMYDKDESQGREVHEVMTRIKTHIDEIGSQVQILIRDDLKQYKNYINAFNNVKYINELVASLDRDFVELIKMAESMGLGQANDGEEIENEIRP